MASSELQARKIPNEKAEKVLDAMIKSSGKINSQYDADIIEGILEIVSIIAGLAGEPNGMAIRCSCQAILLGRKQNQPSVVDRLAKIVDNG